MKLATRGASQPVDAERLSVLHHDLCAELGRKPDLIVAYYTAGLAPTLHEALGTLAAADSVIGVSSCGGVLTETGVYGAAGQGVALLGIDDEHGCYGAGFAMLDDDPAAAAIYALTDALHRAGRPGEPPGLVLLHTTPGVEDQVVAAITDLTQGQSTIMGGSAASNGADDVWSCFANDEYGSHGVAVAVMFPTTSVSAAFGHGYLPTSMAGAITAGHGQVISEIDGEAAAVVYNRWIGGDLDDVIHLAEAQVRDRTSLMPLARQPAQLDTTEANYSLLQPLRITPDHGLAVSGTIEVGQRLKLMTGTPSNLIDGAGHAVRAARSHQHSDAVGGLISFGAECRLAIADDVELLRHQLAEAFDGGAFIAAFTFGEQGRLRCGRHQHGNLMIGAATIETSP